MTDYHKIIDFIRELYKTDEFIPLHAPSFKGNEKKYLEECIDSTFVSSVGKFVDLFEKNIEEYTGAKRAVAIVNGTSALHAALTLVGVNPGDEVITQPLTFIATCNAISYCGAAPVFVDVDIDTMGMSPAALKNFLEINCIKDHGKVIDKRNKKRISACVPMHTFGHPVRIEEIKKICDEWGVFLIEDAAESLGSFVGKKHTGLFGKCGILSFNGNKTITTGGGGMIITDDVDFGRKAKHLTTTAKLPHKWEFKHDMIGFNYRMPNLNAALGCAQLEMLPEILKSKRKIAEQYKIFFNSDNIQFFSEREGTTINYWLNTIRFENRKSRDEFLEITNTNGIMTRPAWILMNKLKLFINMNKADLYNAEILENTIVNIPSSCI